MAASDDVQVVIITGGTGFTGRDSTPGRWRPLDVTVEGFGELFRQISHRDIGSSTVQSRALAGLSNGRLIFCVPGSTQRLPHRLGQHRRRAARRHPPPLQLRRAAGEGARRRLRHPGGVIVSGLSHLNAAGEASMVDVSGKAVAARRRPRRRFRRHAARDARADSQRRPRQGRCAGHRAHRRHHGSQTLRRADPPCAIR